MQLHPQMFNVTLTIREPDQIHTTQSPSVQFKQTGVVLFVDLVC